MRNPLRRPLVSRCVRAIVSEHVVLPQSRGLAQLEHMACRSFSIIIIDVLHTLLGCSSPHKYMSVS